MKLKANRSFHTSGVGMIHDGSEFETHDALGQEMIDKGLATRVGETTPSETGAEGKTPVEAPVKAEPELLNKMEPAAENKRSRRKVRIEEETPDGEE